MSRRRVCAWRFQGAIHENETTVEFRRVGLSDWRNRHGIEATRLTAIDAATSPVGPDIGDCGARGNNGTQGDNLDAWLNKHATTHDGRIAREEFMNQMSRRWDMLDARRSGYMTPDQARRIYM